MSRVQVAVCFGLVMLLSGFAMGQRIVRPVRPVPAKPVPVAPVAPGVVISLPNSTPVPVAVTVSNSRSMTIEQARAVDENIKRTEASLKSTEAQLKRLKTMNDTLAAQTAKLQAEQKQRQAKAKELEKTAETLAEDLKQLNAKAEKAEGAAAEKLQAEIKAAKQKLEDAQAAAKTETQGAEQIAKSLAIFEKRQANSLAQQKSLTAQIAQLKAQRTALQAQAKLAAPILAAEKAKQAALEAIIGTPKTAVNQGFNWQTTDSGGFRWDITQYGTVNDGLNDAYDGGMYLKLNNQQFVSPSSTGKLDRKNNEIYLQPRMLRNLKVYRRIYVDAKGQYARWIDLFENPTNSPITVPLEYYSNYGSSVASSRQFGQSEDEEDNPNGLIGLAVNSSSSSRPAVSGIYGLRNAKTKFSIQCTRNSQGIYVRTQLTVPAGQVVGLCVFQMQRRGFSDATKALETFAIDEEYEKIPEALRELIVNFTDPGMSLGSLRLPRNKESDLLVDRQGHRCAGTILNEAFTLKTDFGPVTVPAKTVLGLDVSPATQRVRIGLTDGQIVSGDMEQPVRLKLADGKEESFHARRIQAMGYQISPDKPGKLNINTPMIQLLDGAMLAGPKDIAMHLLTEHGLLKLKGDMLMGVRRNREGGADLVMFRNGGKLAGLWTGPVIKTKTTFGPEVAIHKNKVAAMAWPGKKAKPAGLSKLALKNGDAVYGKLAGKPLTVLIDGKPQPLKIANLASIALNPEDLGVITVKYHDGKTLTGKLQDDAIQFDLGLTKPVSFYPGHVVRINIPKPPAPKPRPTTEVKPKPTTAPARPATAPASQPAATAEANLKKFIPALFAIDVNTIKAVCEAPFYADSHECSSLDDLVALAQKQMNGRTHNYTVLSCENIETPERLLKKKEILKDLQAYRVVMKDNDRGREQKVIFFVNPKTNKVRGFDD